MSNSPQSITHYVKHNPWRFGVLYVDAADPRLIVRQRTGLGWTLNFGHPVAYALIAGLLVASRLARRITK